MEGLKFLNLNDPLNRWPLEKVVDIVTKVKDYTDRNGISDPELLEVEDQSYYKGEETNKRIDIRIRYYKGNQLYEQWLWIMKGKVIDGDEFHERHNEFYPEINRQ